MNEQYYPYGQEPEHKNELAPVTQDEEQPVSETIYRYKRVDNGAIPKDPVKKEKKPRGSGKKDGLLKRAAALLLAGVLFGGAAGGVFVGITYVAQKNGVIAGEDTAKNQPETEARTAKNEPETQKAGGQDQQNQEAGIQNAYNYSGQAMLMDVSGVVEQVMPSVVAITNTQIYENYDNYYRYFQYFFGGGPRPDGGQEDGDPQEYTAGSGSGIIVGENDEEYLIVTNQHVIEGADSLTITFNDTNTAKANLKGSDAEADLAVVAVAKSDLSDETKAALKVASLGDSGELKAGQGVIAIGNALGFGQSVTVGYISALNREVTTSDRVTRTLLQTDAAINPGNSGGALVNTSGEVIGINSAKYSDTDVEGIGYAIPVSAVKEIIDDLMGRKTIVEVPQEERGYLGIRTTSVDDTTATNLSMPKGAYVYSIYENGAAASTDLAEKDIITALDGQRVKDQDALIQLLSAYRKGDTVELTVQRLENGDYVEHKISVTLGGKVE